MKNILDDVVTDDDVRFLVNQAKIRAADGDNEALRIILAYKYGTPTAFHNAKQDKPSGGDSTTRKVEPAKNTGKPKNRIIKD